MRRTLCPILLLAGCGILPAEALLDSAEPLEVAELPAPTNSEPVQAVAVLEEVQQADAAVDEPAEPPRGTEPPAKPETHILSDSLQLGINDRSAVYRGNVRLHDPRIHLTCEQLIADVPAEGGRLERVVAETNVVIVLIDEDGKTNRAYADRAVYTYSVTDAETNEIVELTGSPSPRIERAEGTLYGDPIVWDRIRNQIRATNQRMVYRAGPTNLTDAIPSAGNEPAAAESMPDE